MSVIATDTKRLSNLVKREMWEDVGYCRNVVTVNEGAAKSYVVGTVLGKVTASGKYKIAVETATDGSKVGAAIVIANASISASTDTSIVVLVNGPASVSKSALVIDASYDDATKLNTLYADFEAKRFQILDTVATAVAP